MKKLASTTLVLLLAAASLLRAHPLADELAPLRGPLGGLRFDAPKGLGDLEIGSVNAIAQDPLGFVWLATSQGLYRYDGLETRRFAHDESNPRSLAHSQVWSLHIDQSGRLWAGTQHGVSRYDSSTESFDTFLSGEHWPNPKISNRVNRLLSDSLGRVLAATEAGYLFRLEPARNSFVQLNAEPFATIRTIEVDPLDRIWIGLDDSIVSYHPDSQQRQEFNVLSSREDKSAPNPVNSIHYAHDSQIWVGASDSGVALLDPRSQTVRFLPLAATSERHVAQILPGPDGEIWTVASGAIDVYNRDGEKLSRIASDTGNGAIPLAGISTAYHDRQGNIWIGTQFDGVALSSKSSSFQNLTLHSRNPDRQPNPPVHALLKDRHGKLWVSHRSAGFDVYPADGGPARAYRHRPEDPASITDQSIQCFFEDSQGDVWIGARRGGLQRYLPETDNFKTYPPDPRAPASEARLDVRGIAEDQRGNLWIAAHGAGIGHLDRSSGRFTLLPSSVGPANAILYDRQSRLWIGGSRGASVIDAAALPTRSLQELSAARIDFPGPAVKQIYQDSRQRLWLATEDGLKLHEPSASQFKSYSVESGLPHRSVASIVEDQSGKLWLGTHHGLARFDPETTAAKSYDDTHGLAANRFLDRAALVDSDGFVHLGHPNGVTRFHPAAIEENTHVPPVFITSLLLFNEPLPIDPAATQPGYLRASTLQTERISLRHDQNTLTIRFAALNFVRSHANRYSYRLDGFDKDWSPPSARPDATYANLSPGAYTFHVRAANNDGLWNEVGDTLAIEILPPYYGSLWFRVAAGLALASVPFLLALWRLRSIKAKKRRLESAVDERTRELKRAHGDLQHAYNQIFAHGETLEAIVARRTEELEIAKAKAERSDRLKSAFLANISHEIRTPMNAILGFIQFLDRDDLSPDERRRFASIISQNGQSLVALFDDIIDLSTLEAGDAQISPSPANLHEICADVRNHFGDALLLQPAKRISLEFQPEATPAPQLVEIDPNRLKQILYNLVSNAIKFTDEGVVRFGYHVAADPGQAPRLIFTVSDTGIGIPEERRAEIFEQFHKLERQDLRLTRGAGLGLTITKKLADLMGGQIDLVSAPGNGSTFTVSFPYRPASPPPERQAPPPAREFRPIAEAPDLSSFSILVVEDEPPTRDYLDSILSDTNATVHWAESAAQAKRIYQRHQIHLALVDLKLPDADGAELVRELRRRAPFLPIVTLSAFAVEDPSLDALHAGATAHLPKPFPPGELLKTLARHLRPPQFAKP